MWSKYIAITAITTAFVFLAACVETTAPTVPGEQPVGLAVDSTPETSDGQSDVNTAPTEPTAEPVAAPPTPDAAATSEPTTIPSSTPTRDPVATLTQVVLPTDVPTTTPTLQATAAPTETVPTLTATETTKPEPPQPTATAEPTQPPAPTPEPTTEPSPVPSESPTPEPVLEPLGVRQVTAGYDHTCAILENGGLKCWGDNRNGQLGLERTDTLGDEPGEMGDALPYVDLGEGRTAVQVALGMGHTCALLDNGDVKCWGKNKSGQLGQGHDDDIGKVPGEMGDNLPSVDLGGNAGAIYISAGREHSCALLDDTSVKCWGLNLAGQLGVGHTDEIGDDNDEMGTDLLPVKYTTNNVVIAVEAGAEHTCALYEDGRVKCWGLNSSGQLGHGEARNYGDDEKETKGAEASAELDGDVIIQISLGAGHTCALNDKGEVYCWGNNEFEQLGYRSGLDYFRGDEPNEVGEFLIEVAEVKSDRFSPKSLVSAGALSTCFVAYDDQMQCYGSTESGRLGGRLGRTSSGPEISFDGARIVGVSTSFEHTCVVLDDGTARCWGLNGSGQLGQGDRDNWGDRDGDEGKSNIDALPPIDLGTR